VDKDKQLKIILGVVVLVFIVMVLAAILKPRHKEPAAPAKAAAQTAVPRAEASRQRKVSSFSDWGRDPFTMGPRAVELSGDLVLSGIIWDAKKPYCIINERVVKVGDEISGYKVVDIKKDSVSVRAGEQVKVLRVGRQQ
jgi:hypothetical protein